ncbi:MAG: TIGR03545 family protein [Endomicrobia bacterium]|nr:TIGR03545 family protein [Endomicrobiia bacterium]MCL2799027.1 TIGR03545 family protein [Endomicrobiia bacterium]
MKIFRTTFIIPAVIITALIIVFFIFYFDVYLKKAFICAGEAAFGAKVEIGSVKTTFTKLSLNVNALKIGDKDNEFTNLIDIDNINFKVRFIPLLSKKVIIDNMSVGGLKWGTARKTSNKLPPKKKKEKKPGEESFLGRKMKEAQKQAAAEFNAFPGVKRFDEIQRQLKDFSPQSVIDMTGIQSIAKIQTAFVDVMGRYDSYVKTINSFNVQTQIDEVKALTDKISKTEIKTAADAAALKENLQALDAKRKELEKSYSDLKTVQTSLAKDVADQKNMFNDISSLISNDVDEIASKLSVPKLDFKNISRMLFGEIWINRVDKALHYMELVRKYMPEKSKEEKKIEVRERMKGRDIIYPLKHNLPSLWIGNISVSGTTGGEGKENIQVTFKGFVKNITSNQKLIGHNTTFEIAGDDTNQKINLSGTFDRLTEIADDKILFSLEGVEAARLGIPETDYTPSFKQAKSSITAEFILKGNDFTTKAGLYIYGLVYDSSREFPGIDKNISKYVNSLWQGINSINVNAEIGILKESGLKFAFSSDIDKILGQRFGNILNAAIGDVKETIRKEITQYVESQKKVLQAEADNYKAKIQKEIDPKLKDIQKQLNDVKALITKKEDELKKQTASLIPLNLLGK